ncbi:Putative rhamnosyl transferase [Alteribacillus persepolensis]|uniref:Putative rhamnosyl transferase n=1 Tax=Alteribacillus persepolensis TaxID=568899 RepID=A0A1G8IS50_9BACI|nr:glycosyltransferase [Alteribacillus persepolensis]SDI21290.1 Putative rhamnosyl transferase [Alteribacillus persepolensis]
MKKKIIIFNILFNNLRKKHVPPRPHPTIVLTEKWIQHRMQIFMNNTRKSLENQTNQNFIALVRYEDSTEEIVKNALSKYKKLPRNIIFVKESTVDDFIKSKIQGYNYVYLARLDSDDMYHKSMVNRLHKYSPKPGTKVLINQNGFIYHSANNAMATYRKESPPFFILIYKTADYLNGVRHPITKHKEAIRLPHEILRGQNFIVTVHSSNTSSKFKTRNNNMQVNPRQARKILRDFRGK